MSTPGCSVHRGDIMSTSGDFSVHRGDIMMHVGDIMSTLGDVQYIGGYHDACGGISMNTSVHWGFQYKLKGFITLLLHMHHDIPQCTHGIPRCTEHPLMYS